MCIEAFRARVMKPLLNDPTVSDTTKNHISSLGIIFDVGMSPRSFGRWIAMPGDVSTLASARFWRVVGCDHGRQMSMAISWL
jgi:hypothetical protein